MPNICAALKRKFASRYPNNAADGREQATSDASRAMRGGSWSHFATFARCAIRAEIEPYYNDDMSGFRVVLSPRGFWPSPRVAKG